MINNENGASAAEEIGKRLAELRSMNGMKIDEMAWKIGVEGSTYRIWERGVCAPRMSAVISICEEFGVSADWLLGLEKGAAKKPPIGVKPRFMAAENRIVELTEAILRNAHETDAYGRIKSWAEEIKEQCEILERERIER